MKNKTFDCVEMKNSIQQQLLKETKGMSWEEEQAYMLANITDDSEFGKFVREIIKKSKVTSIEKDRAAN